MVNGVCQACVGGSGSAQTPWQVHAGQGPFCFPNGQSFDRHGDPGEYALAVVPAANDPGWRLASASDIGFNQRSALCDTECECHDGGDFTYFQTTFTLPTGFALASLVVRIGSVDDGVRISVYNALHPNGVVDPGAFAFLGGGVTANLAPYLMAGENRVVLTHVDDCCSARMLLGVQVELNGAPTTHCEP
jgi:hypothetical protein